MSPPVRVVAVPDGRTVLGVQVSDARSVVLPSLDVRSVVMVILPVMIRVGGQVAA
jgi:hypothetical protein